jgi:alkylhydroperoxidase family enzyme
MVQYAYEEKCASVYEKHGEKRAMPEKLRDDDASDTVGLSRIPPMPERVLAQFPDAVLHAGASDMSTLFRVMGHRPEVMRPAIELLEAAMRGGTVEPQLKELVAVRVSQVNHCSY